MIGQMCLHIQTICKLKCKLHNFIEKTVVSNQTKKNGKLLIFDLLEKIKYLFEEKSATAFSIILHGVWHHRSIYAHEFEFGRQVCV